jgi:hypothetical protein
MGFDRIMFALCSLGLVSSLPAAAFENAITPNSEFSRRDVRASYCEIFVDKALVYRETSETTHVTMWVRTNNTRLDSYVSGVGFYGRARLGSLECEPNDKRQVCKGVNEWRDYPLTAFAELPNYFSIDFTIASPDFGAKSYEGAFYIETVAGTRYWANAENFGNFVVDKTVAGWVEKAMNGRTSSASDITAAVSTSESFYYFNPNRCR